MDTEKIIEIAKKGGASIIVLWLIYNSILPLLNNHGNEIKVLQIEVNQLNERIEKAEGRNKKLGMLLLELNKDNPLLATYLIKIFSDTESDK